MGESGTGDSGRGDPGRGPAQSRNSALRRGGPGQLCLRRVGRGVSDSPNAKEVAASIVKTAGEIDDLELGKNPRKLFLVARSIQQWSDASFESVLLKGVQEFSLHPCRSHGVGREYEDEPIATLERSADLVVPLLGTLDLGIAVPHRNPMAAQHADQPLNKRLILVRMRDKNFRRLVCSPATRAQTRLRSASAMGWISGSPPSVFGRSTQCKCRTTQGISPCGSCSRPPTATGTRRLL